MFSHLNQPLRDLHKRKKIMTVNIALTRIFHILNKPHCDENTKTLQTYLYRNISLTAGHKKNIVTLALHTLM